MDSDQGKLFIGGISWETTEENLKGYFGKYGVVQTVIMRDKLTGKPRGFGFVVFADPSVLDRVLEDTHTINGRTVEAKRALSREQQTTGRSENSNSGRGGAVNTRTKKIFIGGLPATLSEDEFRQYFQTFGNVVDVVVMYDQNTQRPRGFGFISFDEEEAVDRVLHKTFHDLQGKQVEVKRALPRMVTPAAAGPVLALPVGPTRLSVGAPATELARMIAVRIGTVSSRQLAVAAVDTLLTGQLVMDRSPVTVVLLAMVDTGMVGLQVAMETRMHSRDSRRVRGTVRLQLGMGPGRVMVHLDRATVRLGRAMVPLVNRRILAWVDMEIKAMVATVVHRIVL